MSVMIPEYVGREEILYALIVRKMMAAPLDQGKRKHVSLSS